jgi:hypothetical protein
MVGNIIVDLIILYLNIGQENSSIISLFLFASVVTAVFDAEISDNH